MKMPGFTAEESFYNSIEKYHITSSIGKDCASNQEVVPQMMRVFRHGNLTLICHYDDKSGELGFCDVYF